MAPNPFHWGDIEYTFADSTRRTFRGGYNSLNDSYRIIGDHGGICPWEMGGRLAKNRGVPVVEVLFHDERLGEVIELYLDESGLWTISMGDLLLKMAPVYWQEALS